MKKVQDFIKKHDNIFVLAVFAVLLIFYCFFNEIEVGDELWNFQSIYKMYNGYTIYSEFNVVQTPIFFIIGKYIFKILSPNMISFRIYNLLINLTLFMCIYILFKKIKCTKRQALFFSMIIIGLVLSTVSSGANYNTMAILYIILGIMILMKSRENKKYLFLNGIILYLVIFTKQNIGFYYFVGICLAELMLNKKVLLTIKELIMQFGVTSILTIITIIGMYKYNILLDFINYTVLGIGEFAANNVTGMDIFDLILIISILLIYAFSIFIIKNKNEECRNEVENVMILLSISAPSLLIIYPILNQYHLILGLICSYILFLYIVHIFILKEILSKKTYDIICFLGTISIIVLLLLNGIINIDYQSNEFDKNNPYYKCYISEENINKIKNIVAYVEEQNKIGKDVIICSQDAALYMIQLNQNYGYFDLPLLGNLGQEGEDGVIEKIKQLDNFEILIVNNEEDIFWQESVKVRDYITNDLTQKGEIENFLIYE